MQHWCCTLSRCHHLQAAISALVTVLLQWGRDGGMANFEKLSAWTCQFTGTLPAQWSGQLHKFSIINIGNNRITGESRHCTTE